MIGTAIAIVLRGLAGALPALLLCTAPAAAQFSFPFPAPPAPSAPTASPNAGVRNQACLRLESQLAAVDRGGAIDPPRAGQIKRYAGTAAKPHAEAHPPGPHTQRPGCPGARLFSPLT